MRSRIMWGYISCVGKEGLVELYKNLESKNRKCQVQFVLPYVLPQPPTEVTSIMRIKGMPIFARSLGDCRIFNGQKRRSILLTR